MSKELGQNEKKREIESVCVCVCVNVMGHRDDSPEGRGRPGREERGAPREERGAPREERGTPRESEIWEMQLEFCKIYYGSGIENLFSTFLKWPSFTIS